jgi:hypothetical protein
MMGASAGCWLAVRGDRRHPQPFRHSLRACLAVAGCARLLGVPTAMARQSEPHAPCLTNYRVLGFRQALAKIREQSQGQAR